MNQLELPQTAPPEAESAPDENRIEGRKTIAKSAALNGRTWNEELSRAFVFVKKLNVLRDECSAHLAFLRRNAGETLATARNLESFYRLRPPQNHSEKYFLVATLFDHNRARPISGDLGETMRLTAPNDSGSFERRVLALLDADFTARWDENERRFYREGGTMAFRLLQMVRLSASKNIGISWPVLIADLCLWDDAHKAVQKKWARNFFDFREAEPVASDLLDTDNAPREYSHAADTTGDN